MKKSLMFFLIIGLVTFGCVQDTTREYVCSDGTIVSNPDYCPVEETEAENIFETSPKDEEEISTPVNLNIIRFEKIEKSTHTNNGLDREFYNLSSEENECLLAAEAVDEDKIVYLIEYNYENVGTKPYTIDPGQIRLLSEEAKEFTASTPNGGIGIPSSTCKEFISSFFDETFNLNPDETSDNFKALFIISQRTTPTNFKYYIGFDTYTT